MKSFYLFLSLVVFATLVTAQTKAPAVESNSAADNQPNGTYAHTVSPKSATAKQRLQYFADQGNKGAMHALARLFIRTNTDSAIYWYGKSADAGDGEACYYYGMIYRRPLYGAKQDFVKASHYFYKGMRLGDVKSKRMVAYFLYKGFEQKQDYDSAFLLYSQLATKAKDIKSMYYLGNFYRNGYGTKRNSDSATYWLKLAADADLAEAKHELNKADPENPEEPIETPKEEQTVERNTIYRRIKHNMPPEVLPGFYAGYVIRYDWSGKHVLSVFPVQASFKGEGEHITGTWIEGQDTAKISAVFTDSNLLFKDTKYKKIDHYSGKKHDPVQFKNARLDLLMQPDSLYITGNLQLYDLKRHLPGRPMYVHLSRVAVPTMLTKVNPLEVKAFPNPFKNQFKVEFALASSQKVNISLVSMQGQTILKEDAGLLQPGIYQHDIQVPTTTAAGNYILLITAGDEKKQVNVLKTNN